MKAATFTLSILNVTAGVGLSALYVSQSSPPAFVLVLSLVLLVQGSYTIAFISGTLRSHHEVARRAQLGGSILALVAGTVGFAAGLFANINPVNADPEYGPMTIALLIAGHGFFSLLAFIPPRIVKTPSH
jgi:uncharacterized membrane protein HdeD (DUF308 family)